MEDSFRRGDSKVPYDKERGEEGYGPQGIQDFVKISGCAREVVLLERVIPTKLVGIKW